METESVGQAETGGQPRGVPGNQQAQAEGQNGAENQAAGSKDQSAGAEGQAADGKTEDGRIMSGGRLIDPSKPMIALTYDDGPYAPVGNRIMDCMEKYNGRATFFVVGNRAGSYQEELRRMQRQAMRLEITATATNIFRSWGRQTSEKKLRWEIRR